MTDAGISIDPDTLSWDVLAERNGVRLLARGQGTPVFIFSGLEGSGESCLHLALPTIEATIARRQSRAFRPVLLDYSRENHASFEDLVDTAAELVSTIRFGPDGCRVWCQSFGNLLGCSTALAAKLPVEKYILVSAFTELPHWKTTLTPPLLSITPDFLYRWTIKPLSRWQFGPDAGNTKHAFYASLRKLTRLILKRRAGWLRGRRFDDLFRSLQGPRKVWLGTRDRLVDFGAQEAFFSGLAAAGGGLEFETIEGSGHVALPPPVILAAREQLAAWFWSTKEKSHEANRDQAAFVADL